MRYSLWASPPGRSGKPPEELARRLTVGQYWLPLFQARLLLTEENNPFYLLWLECWCTALRPMEAEGSLSVWSSKCLSSETPGQSGLQPDSSELHPGETFYLIVSLLHFHAAINIFLTVSFPVYIYHQFMLIFFAFDNDDMESPKRRVTFFFGFLWKLKRDPHIKFGHGLFISL